MSIKDFQVLSKLGEGAYSSVYKVKRLSDGQEYALKKVKLMSLSDKEKLNALNEVRILASIRHPNMIAYKEAFLDEASNSLCIVMEYADNGDLFQKIVEHQKKGTLFPEPEIWNIFIQMVKGLKSLHDLKILHRDLKSANIFLNKDGTIKLGDLNVSKVAKKGLLYTQTGTPYYASPEVWRDMPYDHKSDVWSLGCVLYEMTTLKPPFRAEDMEGLYKKVLRGYYPRIPTHFSQDLNNVIRALLQVSPHLRPSCDKILQLPAVVKRMEDKHLTEIEDGYQSQLLSTIRIPKNLHFLTERLPKPNYAPLKIKKVEKHKFLQTLGGHKDTSLGAHRDASQNSSVIEEAVRGSESVDNYTKRDRIDRDDSAKLHLPAISKEAHHKDILKIYGTREKKPKPNLIEAERAIINIDADLNLNPVRRHAEPRKPRLKERSEREKELLRELREREKERSIEKESEYERPEIGGRHRHQNSLGGREPAVYRVHDLNKDVDKHLANIKHIYGGGKPITKVHELSPLKDPIHSIAKRNKYAPIDNSDILDMDDYLGKKHGSRLPPLAGNGLGENKYSKLPAINSKPTDYSSNIPNIGKNKLKELSKVYKVNIGNLDETSDKYSIASRPIHYQRNKYRPEYLFKNAGSSNNYLDSGLPSLK